MNTLLIGNILGVFGILCYLLCYQIKAPRKLFWVQSAGCMFFCLQFILNHAYSGCVSMLIAMIRNGVILIRDRFSFAAWKGWPFLLTAALVILNLCTWAGPITLLPMCAVTSVVFANWSGNAEKIRSANLFCACPLWAIYDFICGVYTGVLNQLIMMVSILISYRRFGRKNLKEENL